jgi:3',5'-cyclic AMP phosphodiesterase CpdA
MLIAQLTDTHIKPAGRLAYRRVDTEACLRRAVAQVASLKPRPDVVLLTGDLVDAGRPEEYALLRSILEDLPKPYYLIPGNHDERRALAAAFRDHAYLPQDGEFLHYAVDDHPVRLIGLDTIIPGEPGGAMCETRTAWLAAQLAKAPDRPTILFMHHPPFKTGIEHMDAMRLADEDRLAAVVRRHPQVIRVLCGHVHRAIQAPFAGTTASIAPSTAHQVALDLRPQGPSAFMLEPPGFQLHLYDEQSGLVTHTAAVGAFDGPYPFFDEGALID